jgi:hypothetical protein
MRITGILLTRLIVRTITAAPIVADLLVSWSGLSRNITSRFTGCCTFLPEASHDAAVCA